MVRAAGSFLIEGLRPSNSPTRSLAGTPYPAPFAWLARGARSRRSRCYDESGPIAQWSEPPAHFLSRGFAPRTPRHAHSRGPRTPLRSRGSLAVLARAVADATM